MKRMKTFIKYLIWVILFYILSNVLISIGLRNEYKDLKEISNDTQSPLVTISEAKAVTTGGKVSGKIENNSNDFISSKYIKVDLYSKRGINLGTQYYKIDALETGKSKDFDFTFNVDNAAKYSVTLSDEAQNIDDSESFFVMSNINPGQRLLIILGGLMLM